MTHVLIVEDHEENRMLLKMLLEVNGYRVTAAGDGVEALAAARRDPPEVIVSDALMPKMDGFALCRAWMQDARLKTIPFIFYSATYVRPENEQLAMGLGAVRYLIKPLEAEVFLRELRTVLQQWAGQVAPSPASPLDDATSRALHESVLAHKLDDKMAQLEAANRRLQESEARFRSLSEMSSDFYWESDAEHRLTQRNSAGNRPSTVSEFARGAQIGARRWDIPYLSPDAAGWAAHRAVLDAHQPFREFELSRLGSDGSERFISISGDPVFDASRAFAGYRGVGTDITKRKRAENALRESEAGFRSLFQSMLNGFAYCRMEYDERDRPVDFVYLKVNNAFERLTGLKDVVGRRVSEVLPGIRELSPELFEVYGRVASGGIPEVFEFDFKSLAKWLMISVYSPGRGEFVAIFDDITERKRAEESLRDSEQELRAIFDGALDGILVTDAESRKLLAANAAICAMLGYTHAEIVGISISDIHPQQDLPRAIEQFERQLRGEIQMAVNIPMLRKDGSVFYADVKSARIRIGGKDAMLGVFRDVTERRVAEARIQRLTQLYAALSQCNEAIVRCASDEELFPRICRAAVEFGGMKMAWIGMVDPDTRMIRLAASLGDRADEYLQGMQISVDADSPLGRGPVGTAVRENHPVWIQDFQNHPRTAPWHVRRAHFGFGASASLPLHRHGAAVGALTLYAGEVGAFDEAARRLLAEMATDISFALDNFVREAQIEHYVAQLETAFMSTVQVATNLGEMRDPYTAGHQRRVAEIAVAIGAELGFDARRQEGLRVAGYLHDVGKIKIPSDILSKPGRLSEIEFELIKAHAQAGYDVLKDVKFPWPVAEVALQHHERSDGSGYPRGLKGAAILLEARIMAVADTMEAMSSHRPYRPGLGVEVA